MKYSQLFYDIASQYKIPVTFGCGLPVSNSTSAELMRNFLAWKTTGYHDKDALYAVMFSESFDRQKLIGKLAVEDETIIHDIVDIAGKMRLSCEHVENENKLEAYIREYPDNIDNIELIRFMFAEFERRIHAMAELGEPMTVESLKGEYRQLLDAYFGANFEIDTELSLECFRIPHFYRAFYVYKYATGLSAAIALSRRVLEGGKSELQDYLRFLKGGCSKDPLDLLRDAGVDMTKPEPVDTALAKFGELVSELDRLV